MLFYGALTTRNEVKCHVKNTGTVICIDRMSLSVNVLLKKAKKTQLLQSGQKRGKKG